MNGGYLLDTNVLSETLRRHPEPRVAGWLSAQDQEAQFLSVVTLGELRRGIALLTHGARRMQLESFVQQTVPLWFARRVLPVTQAIAERWGTLDAQRQLVGRPLNMADGLIAATALDEHLTLVTRNEKDFADLGVPLFNPWKNQP